MNKKNKNKNRSKPVNPTPPPQKTEPTPTTDENITVVVEEKSESLIKESDSVVETISEVSVPNTNESSVSNDTPKKPKRNKGKKKQQDESGFDISKVVSSDAPLPLHASEVKDESKTEITESKIEEEQKIEDNIIPSARKKKNKKKQNDQSKVQEIIKENVSTESLKEDVKKEDILTEATPKSENPVLETEIEPKQSKKKSKKKKNRNDSEKSDKTEETVTCTAVFQKLLTSASDEPKIRESIENIQPSADSKEENKETDLSAAERNLKDLIESVLMPEEIEKESIKDEALKGKKKNKKDKKQHQQKDETEKTHVDEVKVTKEDASSVASTEILSCETLKSDGNQDKEPDQSKSKAKIVKPVEKKRKGKPDLPENLEIKSEDTVTATGNITAVLLEEEKVVESNTAELPKITASGTVSFDLSILGTKKSVEPIALTEEHTSPIEMTCIDNADLVKTDADIKSTESVIEPNKILATDLLKSDNMTETDVKSVSLPKITSNTAKDISAVSDSFKTVEKKRKKHSKKIDTASDITIDKINNDKVLVTPDSEIINKEKSQKEKEDIFLLSPGSGVEDMSSLKGEDSVLVTPESEIAKKETQQKDNEDYFDLSGSADVEISSLKTDDMEGSCDVTPDFIHHPLASSQQLIDDNNNMLIREITSTDEKFPLPILIPTEPIVQGSGETPEIDNNLRNPTTLSKEQKQVISKTNEPEKTDLKSKMMEVSQDMEELRLSIERSLAELTSMEKNEQDVEKKIIEIDTPALDTVTEPIASAIKDDQATSGVKSINENVVDESSSSVTMPEIRDQKNDFNKSKESKLDEPISLSNKSKNVQIEATEIPSKTGNQTQIEDIKDTPPAIPTRKDQKGKGKGKKKGRQETHTQQSGTVSESSTNSTQSTSQEPKQEGKSEEKAKENSQKSESNENKGKQQTMDLESESHVSEEISPQPPSNTLDLSFEPIENFEDALTSSVDDVNKTFEMIANEVNNSQDISFQNPEINIIAPTEETEAAKPKQNPVSPPKNLLGHPDIPVPSNRTDYKKEKNKPPNMRQAKVKIKDAVDIEKSEITKQSKESQTENKRKLSSTKNALESFSYMTNENTQYVYKYSFRKVFLQSLCHVCRKELVQRVPCQFCSLVFYCSHKHKDEDWPQHQSLCFAICTIAHLKDQKHIYADAKNITGHNFRLLRMQMIVSCEKVLKRKLVPWEQEAFLYPRICADVSCREWKQSKLADCEGCGQISYCADHPDHLPTSHQRWCRSYALYQKLVHHQQTKGRLEPKLPTRVMAEGYRIPEKINEILASMYDEKIDMNDTEYAALTQLATAPLTAAYCHQAAMMNSANGISKRKSLVIHIVGAELQFEADVLHKWEVFFLHVKPEVKELKVVLISTELNPSNLPLDLLGKVNLCATCQEDKRRVLFSFQDKKSYYQYWSSDDFQNPDLVCAFNPSIQRSSMYNGKDTWPTSVSCILKLKTPFLITSYSINELQRDITRIKECSELSQINFKFISDPMGNPFASVRPDRNFITDDEIPLLFKNYCFAVLSGI